MIRVVNKYKHKITENDIYIGRGSCLGNPFTHKELNKTKAKFNCNSRQEAISNYEIYLRKKIIEKDKEVCNKLNEIYSKSLKSDIFLVCFCKPSDCHGDIIKKIIEEKLFGLNDFFDFI